MDNEGQISPSFSVTDSLRRTFIKPFFNQEYDSSRVEEAINLIDSMGIICLYGISLAESDLTWRKKIIEWLKVSKSHHLFIYDYSLSTEKWKTVQVRMNKESEEKKKKMEEWGVDDYDSFIGQIHLIIGKNIFNISDVIKTEKAKNKNQKNDSSNKTKNRNAVTKNKANTSDKGKSNTGTIAIN